jgi:hypothetical protein
MLTSSSVVLRTTAEKPLGRLTFISTPSFFSQDDMKTQAIITAVGRNNFNFTLGSWLETSLAQFRFPKYDSNDFAYAAFT